MGSDERGGEYTYASPSSFLVTFCRIEFGHLVKTIENIVIEFIFSP